MNIAGNNIHHRIVLRKKKQNYMFSKSNLFCDLVVQRDKRREEKRSTVWHMLLMSVLCIEASQVLVNTLFREHRDD